jgi:hypothetical protein
MQRNDALTTVTRRMNPGLRRPALPAEGIGGYIALDSSPGERFTIPVTLPAA